MKGTEHFKRTIQMYSAGSSPALSVRPPASVFRLVFLPPFLTSFARRPSPSIAVHRRPSPSIAVHRRPSPPIAVHRRPSPPIPSPPVVRRPLRRPSSSACRLLSVACTPSPAAAPLSVAVRSGPRLLYPRNPGLHVCGSCLPCRSAAVPSVCLSSKKPPPSAAWSPRRF